MDHTSQDKCPDPSITGSYTQGIDTCNVGQAFAYGAKCETGLEAPGKSRNLFLIRELYFEKRLYFIGIYSVLRRKFIQMRIPFIFLIVSLFLVACDSNSEPEDLVIKSIVFEPGQQRLYEQDIVLIGRDFDGNELERIEEHDIFVVEARAESEQVPEIDNTIQIDTRYPEHPESVTSHWYIQSDSQLVEVAYRNAGSYVTLKKGTKGFIGPILPFGEIRNEVPDIITVRRVPRIVLKLPLETEKSWVSLMEGDLLITGEILEPEKIEVPSGEYLCQVIKTIHTLQGSSTEMVHYITSEGLIKRTERSEFPYRDSQNNPAGTATLEKTLILVEVNN